MRDQHSVPNTLDLNNPVHPFFDPAAQPPRDAHERNLVRHIRRWTLGLDVNDRIRIGLYVEVRAGDAGCLVFQRERGEGFDPVHEQRGRSEGDPAVVEPYLER